MKTSSTHVFILPIGSSTGTTKSRTTTGVFYPCQTENVLDEVMGLVTADSITETSKAQTSVVGFVIRMNSTGWTPSSIYASLNIDFRDAVQVSKKKNIGIYSERFVCRLVEFVYCRMN